MSMNKQLSAFVMSITPFDADGALDEPAFRTHLRRLRDAQVRVYVGGSASGEGFSLTQEELDRVLVIAVEELKGKVQVRAMGCEVRHAGEMIDFLRRAERHALDAVHIFAPEMGHAAKPTAAELETYYSAVIDATSLPVVLSSYHTLGFDVPVALIERLLGRFPQIIGFFYGGHDVRYLNQVIARLADRIEIHCAGPSNALTTLGLGGHGFMGHEGNLAPGLVASVISAFQSGDKVEISKTFGTLMRIHAIHFRYGGPVRAMKPLLNAFGLPGGTVRLPRLAISAEQLEEVIEATVRLRIAELPPLVAKRP
jgi:dihydrodipicolinate synthase/N-acetylneuraminate lyase